MNRTASRLHPRDLVSPTLAALISVMVNYGGTFVLVFQAAQLGNLTAAQTASWVWSVSIGVGLTGAWLSWRYRAPIITAWSTPGVAFLATVMPFTPYGEVIGAYVLCAIGFILLGLSGCSSGWCAGYRPASPPGCWQASCCSSGSTPSAGPAPTRCW